MKKVSSLICLLFFLLNILFPFQVQAQDRFNIDKQGVSAMVDSMVDRKNLHSAKIGVFIASLRQPDNPIYNYRGDDPFTPASTLKVITSSAILDLLGPDYTFETKVFTRGNISGSTLNGDLVLYGTGDPSMSDRFTPHRTTAALEMLADQVKAAGIRTVRGNIIGDGTYFDNQEVGEGWSRSYMLDWYSAKVTALAFNDNCIDFKITGSKKTGTPAIVTTDPRTDFMNFKNQTVTTRGKMNVGIDLVQEEGKDFIRIHGAIPPGKTTGLRWVTVGDPLEFTAAVFKEVLQSKGISVIGSVIPVRYPQLTAVGANATKIATYTSPPLSELLKVMNKHSQNLYAEMFLKTMGRIKYGQGSYANGTHAARDFMESVGIDLAGYYQVDGSGLSPLNKITPRQLVGVMAHMAKHKYSRTFYNSLSIPGVDGSLRSRFRDLSSVMRGKTGGINQVRTLTAYLDTQSGEPLVFAIMSNNFSSRENVRVMDNALVEKLAKF